MKTEFYILTYEEDKGNLENLNLGDYAQHDSFESAKMYFLNNPEAYGGCDRIHKVTITPVAKCEIGEPRVLKIK